jgi:hypothetical protein
MLRKVKSYVPQETLHMMYSTSHLYSPISTIVQLYGMMVIKCMPKKCLNSAKACSTGHYQFGLNKTFKIFQMLKWTKIQSILKKRELVMTFKPLRCMAPELYLTQLFHKTIFFKEASPTEEQFHGKKLNNYYYFYYYFFSKF